MREFDQAYIEGELHKLGARLGRPARLHVIGGGAMAFRGQKAGTKDIDVVVDSEAESDLLEAALLDVGYKDPSELAQPYRRMGARRVLENADEFTWDIFVREVMGFEFSDRMRSRVEPWITAGHLTVVAAAPEDIFAFKALTDRERDRTDMNVIYGAGVDHATIRGEVLAQAERPTGKRFAAFFFLGLEAFVETFGVIYPGMDEFEALYIREEVAEMLLTRLRAGALDLNATAADLGVERDVVDAAAQRLERQGLALNDGATLHAR